MHHGASVVVGVQVLDPIQVVFHEVGLGVTKDIVPIDSHVFVSISSGLLVPET